MMKHILIFLTALLLLSGCKPQNEAEVERWPEIEPFETGYMKVSDIHELYYELSGNPEGIPVFVLHGGPGGSSSPEMRRYFNPGKYFIVMHDQRGAGKSRPYAEIKENTTQHLVEDIEQLRKKVGADSLLLFGGSWGSTLALAYAEAYPEHISGMILRGIWTCTDAEIDHFYHGAVRKFYPEDYDIFVHSLPHPDSLPRPDYMYQLIKNNDDETVGQYSDIWTRYEWVISDLDVDREMVRNWLAANDTRAFALIENYYMANQCFFTEKQLWENIGRIRHIPAIIINGRFDMPCPPITAYRLHKVMDNSELIIVEKEGHFGKGIEQALVEAAITFENGKD